MAGIQPVTQRTAPLPDYSSLPHAPPKSGAQGILTHSRDQRILKTPEEVRKDSEFVVPPCVLAKNPEVARTLVQEFTEIGCRKYGDGFNFDKVLLHFYQALFALAEKDQEALSISIEALRRETSGMHKEREEEFKKIAARMEREKTLEWVQLAATSAAAAAATGGAGAPVIALVALSTILEANALLKHPLEKTLDGVFLSESTWQSVTSVATLCSSVLSLFVSPKATNDIGALLQKASQIVTLGTRVVGSADQIQSAYNTKTAERLKGAVDFNQSELQMVIDLLTATHGQQSENIKRLRSNLNQLASAFAAANTWS